jgi:hypothetical protein
VQDRGTFTYLDRAMPTPELNAFMRPSSGSST